MVDIADWLAGGFLKAAWLRERPEDKRRAVILTEPAFATIPNTKDEVLQCDVEFDAAKQLTYTLNKGSANRLKEAWGKDTKAWVGKTIEFELAYVNYKGKQVDSIMAHPCNSVKDPAAKTEDEK